MAGSISPDLSARDPQKTVDRSGSGAETYGVVYTLAESPLQAGTALGRHRRRQALGHRERAARRGPTSPRACPRRRRASGSAASKPAHHDAKVAYLAVDAHRPASFAPLAYRTADGGKTWQSVAGDLPADGPVKVVREDPTNPNVLYAGTEFGALRQPRPRRATGRSSAACPTVAVDDILVHPRDRDLVIATHGRSLFVDRRHRGRSQELTPEVLAKEAHLFPPRPALGAHPLPGFEDWAGSASLRGANPPEGALISFCVKELTGEPVKIAITNAQGQPVANLTAPGLPGLSRVTWDLKPTKDVLHRVRRRGPAVRAPRRVQGDADLRQGQEPSRSSAWRSRQGSRRGSGDGEL